MPRRTHTATLRDAATLALPLELPQVCATMRQTNQLHAVSRCGTLRPATADEILAAACTILARRVRRGASISNPRHTREYLRLHLAPRDHEVFAILFLDNRHRVIEFVPLFRGTIDGASVRELRNPCFARGPAGHPCAGVRTAHADIESACERTRAHPREVVKGEPHAANASTWM
jgi:hypothetical protein